MAKTFYFVTLLLLINLSSSQETETYSTACRTGCKYCKSLDTCEQCEDGYRLNGNACDKCSEDGCRSCSTSTSVCTSCKTNDGWFVAGSTTGFNNGIDCEKCTKNCQSCSSATTCNQCYPLFQKQEDGTCDPDKQIVLILLIAVGLPALLLLLCLIYCCCGGNKSESRRERPQMQTRAPPQQQQYHHQHQNPNYQTAGMYNNNQNRL